MTRHRPHGQTGDSTRKSPPPSSWPFSSVNCQLVVAMFLALGLATAVMRADARPIPKRNRSFSPEIGLYYQGDIMFMPGESFEDHDAMVKPEKMWPKGIVYYEIEDSFSDDEVQKIYKGIAQFHRDTCIKFRKRSGQKGYVLIRKGTGGCSANAGYYGRRQVVNLGDGCFEHGTILHELMHVIGFHHEQSRGDRDRYVNILWENIMPGAEVNFKKFKPGKFAQIGKYDYYSVMHYHAYSFSIDSDQPTVTSKDKSISLDDLGQRVNFSPLDAEKINIFYKCSGGGGGGGSGGGGGGSDVSGFGDDFNEVSSDPSGFGLAVNNGQHSEDDGDEDGDGGEHHFDGGDNDKRRPPAKDEDGAAYSPSFPAGFLDQQQHHQDNNENDHRDGQQEYAGVGGGGGGQPDSDQGDFSAAFPQDFEADGDDDKPTSFFSHQFGGSGGNGPNSPASSSSSSNSGSALFDYFKKITDQYYQHHGQINDGPAGLSSSPQRPGAGLLSGGNLEISLQIPSTFSSGHHHPQQPHEAVEATSDGLFDEAEFNSGGGAEDRRGNRPAAYVAGFRPSPAPSSGRNPPSSSRRQQTRKTPNRQTRRPAAARGEDVEFDDDFDYRKK